MRNKVAVEY